MSNGGNMNIVAGGLTRQQIIDCFTKAGVWLGTNEDEINRQVEAVKLAIEESEKTKEPPGKLLPVKPWEDRFRELHPNIDLENPHGGAEQTRLLRQELIDYRSLFTCNAVDFVNLAGCMTDFQRKHLQALAFNMQAFGREGIEQIIRAASVTGYTNGVRDMRDK